MQLQKVIEQLGYTAREAKVYLAALAIGEAHISDISEKVGMPRSSVQVIVDRLRVEGLMSFYVHRRYKYWAAENPERLLSIYRRREAAVIEAMPRLVSMRKASRSQRKAHHDRLLGMLRVVADDSAEPMLLADKDANILYVNAPWEEEFGYSLDEIVGQSTSMLRSEKTPLAVYDRMWRALESQRLFHSDEIFDKRKDGSIFPLSTTIIPLESGGERFYVQILEETRR